MARHVEILSHFNTKLAAGEMDYTNKDDMAIATKMVIKLADISNPLRKWFLLFFPFLVSNRAAAGNVVLNGPI